MDVTGIKNMCEVSGIKFNELNIAYVGKGKNKKDLFRLDPDLMTFVTGSTLELTEIRGVVYDEGTDVCTVLTYKGQEHTVTQGNFSPKDLVRFAEDSMTYPMPQIDSELNDLFPKLYPNFSKYAYYDDMSEREMVDRSLFYDVPPGEIVELDDHMIATYFDNMERKLKSLRCEGKMTKDVVRIRCLLKNIGDNHKNRFRDWVLSHPWDGVPRVDTWFKKVFNASAPPLVKLGIEDIYLANVARAWFVGAIKRIFVKSKHEIVPVLIGPQGTCKKTSGLEYTAGNIDWFNSTTLDIGSKTGAKDFLDAARGKVIIELGESESIKGNSGAVKNFISMPSDQYRKPYEKREKDWPRHFILAATSNFDDIFTDVTGNRRYYPMYTDVPDFSYRTQENVEQVWAEAYQMYLSGQPTFLEADWAPAVIMQQFSATENKNVETVDNWLNDPIHKKTAINSIISKRWYMREAHGIEYDETIPDNYEREWRLWTLGTTLWKKSPDVPRYFEGLSCRSLFYRCKQANVKMSEMFNNIENEEYDAYEMLEDDMKESVLRAIEDEERYQNEKNDTTKLGKAYRMYRTICNEFHLYSEGMLFHHQGIPQEYIDLLLEEGYIYQEGSKTVVYRVAKV